MLKRSTGLVPVLSAIALVCGVPWAGKAGWACACSTGSAGGEGRHRLRGAGGSSTGMAKCNLVYASQKLKYDPAILKQFSVEKLCNLPAVVQL